MRYKGPRFTPLQSSAAVNHQVALSFAQPVLMTLCSSCKYGLSSVYKSVGQCHGRCDCILATCCQICIALHSLTHNLIVGGPGLPVLPRRPFGSTPLDASQNLTASPCTHTHTHTHSCNAYMGCQWITSCYHPRGKICSKHDTRFTWKCMRVRLQHAMLDEDFHRSSALSKYAWQT